MSYLDRLAMKATGAGPVVRPRVRSRFEPVCQIAGEENVAFESEAALSPAAPDRLPQVAFAHLGAVNPGTQPSRIAPTPEREATPPTRGHTDTIVTAHAAENIAPRVRVGMPPSTATPQLAAAGAVATQSIESGVVLLTVPTPRANDNDSISVPPRAEPPLAPGGAIPTAHGENMQPALTDREPRRAREQGSHADGGVRHVHVTIGRVEVRAVATEPAARISAPKQPAALSLDDYLRRRGQP